MVRKPHRHFINNLKKRVIDPHIARKNRSEIIREYNLTPSTFDKWVKQTRTAGSFKTVDNLTDKYRI